MKNVCFAVLALIAGALASTAQANEVYKCDDGTRTFSVEQTRVGNYLGIFQNFTGAPETFNCERTNRGYNFKCTKGDYIVTVRRGASGDMVVDFELAGDFGPDDSGYLYQLTCK